jgi:hypothetical protein
MILTKEQIDAAIGPCIDYDYPEAAVRLYKLVIPDWDQAIKVDGWPRCGKAISDHIVSKIVAYDQAKHPGSAAGFGWLNNGWSPTDELGDWEVSLEGVEIEYAEQENPHAK